MLAVIDQSKEKKTDINKYFYRRNENAFGGCIPFDIIGCDSDSSFWLGTYETWEDTRKVFNAMVMIEEEQMSYRNRIQYPETLQQFQIFRMPSAEEAKEWK